MINYRQGARDAAGNLRKYVLAQDYELRDTGIQPPQNIVHRNLIYLSTTGELTIKAGYGWDGATGAIDTESIMRASLVHDALYELLRHDLLLPKDNYRLLADNLLWRICLDDDMFAFRANGIYWTVRLVGWYYTKM